MATRMEVVQLESRMQTEDYRKLRGLFMVGSRGPGGVRVTYVHQNNNSRTTEAVQSLLSLPVSTTAAEASDRLFVLRRVRGGPT